MTQRSLEYRPYLDGLRGIAVLLVFVFHAARPGLPGGFIGVDVFFVLSGYLITRILLSQSSKTGRIRVADFYARRIRRLMPAVVALVVVIVTAEALWGTILELANRLRDSIATLFYFQNWNLIYQVDQYFQESAGASPLRHAWSLSIEEQFYILWPLLLVPIIAFGRRSPRRSTGLVLLLAIVSAAAMASLFEPHLVARAYYGTGARVHQPLIGAALAFASHGQAGRARTTSKGLAFWATVAFSSLAILVAAARFVPGTSPVYYRGGSLLIACVTGVLILALERAPTGVPSRVLGWAPLKQLGQISYGFYLWHWPLILWLSVPDGFSFWERRAMNLGQFGLTLAVSITSFRLLENPIREGTARLGRLKARGTIAFGLMTLLIAAGFSFVVLSPDESDLATAALADKSYEPCPEDPEPCVKVEGAVPGAPTVVLIGDSTAQSFDPALKELARKYGFRYVQAAVGGCPIGHRLLATGIDGELHKPSNLLCFDELPSIYDTVISRYRPALIIATSWNETNRHVEDGQVLEKGTPEHLMATERALREAVSLLTSAGGRLVFIDVLPPGFGVECLEEGPPTSDSCIRPVTDASGERPYNALFASLEAELRPQVADISLTDVICPEDECPLTVGDLIMRYDGVHLTGAASRHLAPTLERRLLEAGIDLSLLLAPDDVDSGRLAAPEGG